MKRTVLGLLVAGVVAAGATLGSHAAHAAEEHAHEHASAAHALELNDGQKWGSDEVLRTSMTRIRDAVDATLPAIHGGKFGPGQYETLGGQIDAQVANIVQNCKLEPAADEVLHAILAGIMEGNEKLRASDAKTRRNDGVIQVVRSLEQYGEYFEHAGFVAPKTDH